MKPPTQLLSCTAMLLTTPGLHAGASLGTSPVASTLSCKESPLALEYYVRSKVHFAYTEV